MSDKTKGERPRWGSVCAASCRSTLVGWVQPTARRVLRCESYRSATPHPHFRTTGGGAAPLYPLTPERQHRLAIRQRPHTQFRRPHFGGDNDVF